VKFEIRRKCAVWPPAVSGGVRAATLRLSVAHPLGYRLVSTIIGY